MCPFCLGGAVLLIGSVVSAGGLTAFAAARLSAQHEEAAQSDVKKSSLSNKSTGGNHAGNSTE
jgi:hypothetical protein